MFICLRNSSQSRPIFPKICHKFLSVEGVLISVFSSIALRRRSFVGSLAQLAFLLLSFLMRQKFLNLLLSRTRLTHIWPSISCPSPAAIQRLTFPFFSINFRFPPGFYLRDHLERTRRLDRMAGGRRCVGNPSSEGLMAAAYRDSSMLD